MANIIIPGSDQAAALELTPNIAHVAANLAVLGITPEEGEACAPLYPSSSPAAPAYVLIVSE